RGFQCALQPRSLAAMMQMETDEQLATTQEFILEANDDGFRSDPGALMAIDVAATSDPGHVRPNNEDHYLVIKFSRSLHSLYSNVATDLLPQDYDLTGYGLVVADGLGGMAGGEIARRTALAKFV